ncbi:MAG: NAD-dependent epimerase/dehydratase family protein [Ignavibacteriaceae bacterium]|nr:NAD-dependent epimerase/dehydratase family protein [Ignavibacteriaceae bacterium]
MNKQTILGAGGAIGTDLAKYLTEYTKDIRLAGRNPKKVNKGDELFPADLTKREEVFRVVKGSAKVFVTIGFEYRIKVWQELWPTFIQNVIDACSDYKAELIFFDNIYALEKCSIKHITESSSILPQTEKGKVRAEVDRKILNAIEKRKVRGIIARAPDFYGRFIASSVLMNTVYSNMAKRKTSQWFCNADVLHTFGYTPDLAKGMAILGNTATAFNQVWNLPTDKALTGREWVSLFAKEMKGKDKVRVIPSWLIKSIGIFNPVLGELNEMLYQYKSAYVFDSSKFQKAFNFRPVSNEQGVRETVKELGRKAG